MVAVLFALLLLALASQGVMTYASHQALRDRETLLIRVGEAYRRAIGAYYEASPGSVKQWPRTLDDLLEDRRFVGVRRHLRELYADPVARNLDWGVIRNSDGGIVGIYTQAAGSPVLSGLFEPTESGREVTQYREIQFVYKPVMIATSGRGVGR